MFAAAKISTSVSNLPKGGTRFFCNQHFYKQRQTETGKNFNTKLSNTLRLNCYYLKTISFFHPSYYPEIIGNILKNVQKTSASVLMTLHI